MNEPEWEDEIVAEVRRIRQEFAARFNNDLNAMVRHLKQMEQQHKDRLVSHESVQVVRMNRQFKQTPVKKDA